MGLPTWSCRLLQHSLSIPRVISVERSKCMSKVNSIFVAGKNGKRPSSHLYQTFTKASKGACRHVLKGQCRGTGHSVEVQGEVQAMLRYS
jgi:hypothetical protein